MTSLTELIISHKDRGEREELVQMESEITVLISIVRARVLAPLRDKSALEIAKRTAASNNLRQAKENHQLIVEAILFIDSHGTK